MFYEKETIDRLLYCSFCGVRFSDVVKLIPECGNSICGECHDGLRDELETLPAQYTCKACGEGDHLFPTKGVPSNKSLMELAKTTPSERPLANNLCIQSSDHLETLATFSIEPIKDKEPNKGENTQAGAKGTFSALFQELKFSILLKKRCS